MLLSLSTASFYPVSFRRVVMLAADAGFDGVEVMLGPRTPLRHCEAMATIAGDHGLRILSVHQSLLTGRLGWHSPAKLVHRAVAAARCMGAQVAVVHPPGTFGWRHPQASAWLEALLLARDETDREGLAVTVENAGHYTPEDRSRVLVHLPSLVAFCRKHGVGMTFDTCHVGSTGESLFDAWGLAGPMVRNVHVSDFRAWSGTDGGGLTGKLAYEHLFPGEGDLPLPAFLQQIASEQYGGLVTTEVSMLALGGWRPGRWSERLASLAFWVRQWDS
ncbi:MAG: sugar phosphate isomerase/epimerase family protein [Anaerolineae bacterium]